MSHKITFVILIKKRRRRWGWIMDGGEIAYELQLFGY
jgi:hypothetical protein